MTTQLSVSQESIVCGGSEEGSVEVARQGALCQGQVLHSSCYLLFCFLAKQQIYSYIIMRQL